MRESHYEMSRSYFTPESKVKKNIYIFINFVLIFFTLKNLYLFKIYIFSKYLKLKCIIFYKANYEYCLCPLLFFIVDN